MNCDCSFTCDELLTMAIRTFERLDAGTQFIVQDPRHMEDASSRSNPPQLRKGFFQGNEEAFQCVRFWKNGKRSGSIYENKSFRPKQ